MFRIEIFVVLAVVFAMVQSQPEIWAMYLKSWAEGSHYTFSCDSNFARWLDSRDGSHLFRCNDELCLDGDIDVCDSIINCPNFADELPGVCESAEKEARWQGYCGQITKEDNGKPFNGTTCTNGMCITECDMCDGYFDCSDGSDEQPEICRNHINPGPEICTSNYRRKRAIST